MLVAEDLDLGRWLRRRPLIYSILYESLFLTALFICFHVVEHIVIGRFKGEALAASVPHIVGGGLAGLACVAAILFIALIPFFAFKYIGRALGEGRLRAMLFRTDVSVPADPLVATISAVANDRAKFALRMRAQLGDETA